MSREHPRKSEIETFIRLNYERMTANEMADHLYVNHMYVRRRLSEMRLKAKPDKRGSAEKAFEFTIRDHDDILTKRNKRLAVLALENIELKAKLYRAEDRLEKCRPYILNLGPMVYDEIYGK